MRPPPTAPFNNAHLFFVDVVRRGRSTLMNSKMLRFAFQFSNLPLKGNKVPRNNPSAKSHQAYSYLL